MRRVVRYEEDGRLQQWPSLNQGRDNHACGAFTDTSGNLVIKDPYCNLYRLSNLIFVVRGLSESLIYLNKVYLVTGGYHRSPDSRLSSTERLVLGDTTWSTVASLPFALDGLMGVTIDNTFFVSG